MAKKIYVDGSILIKTSDFKYEGAGALFDIPKDAETIEPNEVIDGVPFLVIDDKRPLSIFNEYYAKGSFSSLYCVSYYLNSNYQIAYDNYEHRKNEIECMLEGVNKLAPLQQELTYKLLLLNVVTLFDAFVCETIVSRITSSKECFDNYYAKFYNSLTEDLQQHFNKLERGKLEQEVVSYILERSYTNVKSINQIYSSVYGFNIGLCRGCDIDLLFQWRHRIVHRNGREKDGTFHQFVEKDVRNAITVTTLIIEAIMSHIKRDETHGGVT